MISLILARSLNNVIGIDGKLPWKLKDDMELFREHTMGKPVVMGRKTWESIGKPLMGRENIVVTSNPDYPVPQGVLVATSYERALVMARARDREVMIIGGSSLYDQAFPQADRVYCTTVFCEVYGDTKFEAELGEGWIKQPATHSFFDWVRNDHPFIFEIYDRAKQVPDPTISL